MTQKWNFRAIVPLFTRFSALLAFLIFIFPQEFALFGTIGWWALIILLYSRPLADLFPKGNIFAQMLFLRKGLGIFAGAFMLAHAYGFFFAKEIPLLPSIINAKYWNLTNLFGWGMIAAVITIPLLVTSNKWSMRKLGKYWKWLQRLAYVLFVAAGIHIAFAQESVVPLAIVIFWSILWVLAGIKRREQRQISTDAHKPQ